MKKLILISICIGLMGCVSPTTQRGIINDQIFYSTGIPKMQVNVADKPDTVISCKNRKLKHFKNNSQTFSEDREQYVFLNLDGRRIKSGVAIEYTRMNKGYYFPDVLAGVENPFDSGKISIDGKMFHYFYGYVTSNYALRKPIVDKIDNTEIILPNYFLIRAIGRRFGIDKRIVIYISYFENINFSDKTAFSYNDWKNEAYFTDEQRQILKDIKKRGDRAFTISHELDSSEPIAKTIQDDSLQHKLKLLKQSYEAELITKEEYEAKKNELLNEL